MANEHDSMMGTPIESLLEATGSKFSLVTLASKRARQINAYFGQLGGGLGASIPPQVTSVAHKPLTIAFEEISAKKIVMGDPAVVAAQEAAAAAAAAQAEADMRAAADEAAAAADAADKAKRDKRDKRDN